MIDRFTLFWVSSTHDGRKKLGPVSISTSEVRAHSENDVHVSENDLHPVAVGIVNNIFSGLRQALVIDIRLHGVLEPVSCCCDLTSPIQTLVRELQVEP